MTTLKNKKVLSSWSGGKDSCLALWRAHQAGAQVKALFTMFDEDGERSRSHGVRPEVMRAQAAAMGLPLVTAEASWAGYEGQFIAQLQRFADDGVEAAVFGDIDLDAHREWEEKVCAAAGIEAALPLWQQPREALVREGLDAGIRALVVTVNAAMAPAGLLGKTLTHELVDELAAAGIDPCAEAGEFHTLVVDGPLFAAPLALVAGEVHAHGDYRSLDLNLA
ncbi:diphthine--ammonia ligase [Crenobacter cavernae]|uniref:Diphthine--ammonia ligase n=1 Tax=Crenobacter cavernae TaxID=2290923 RepID=A0ABY0FEG8_9NEIS|nr:diphthine--ammonia ligase [Crenobacter cavernae]RXZ42759.1 diphthine--ammonia ligase [Crenobacter cavernae]